MHRLRNQRGLSFASVLMALLIGAALYFGYFRMASTNEKKVSIQSLDTTKNVACRTQRQQIERDVQGYIAQHDGPPASLGELERGGIDIPSCPEGGRYALSGLTVTCTKHQ